MIQGYTPQGGISISEERGVYTMAQAMILATFTPRPPRMDFEKQYRERLFD